MKHNRKGYIDPLPYEIYEEIRKFRDAYDTILSYHMNIIQPEIERNGMDIVLVCHLLSRCLSDEAFNVYKRYAMLAPQALDILNNYYVTHNIKPGDIFIEPNDKAMLFPLDLYVEEPLNHLRKYSTIIQKMMQIVMNTVEDNHVRGELLRLVTNTSLQMENFQRTIQETYKIHRKRSLVVSLRVHNRLVLFSHKNFF